MNQRFIEQLECISDAYGNESSFVVLKEKVEDGAKYRFGNIGKAVKNRLTHEFELFLATNTAKIFLCWADIVAKIRQITYPYVCSAQNCSLICYCLGITEVNPLLTGSYFERLLHSQSRSVPILFIEVPKGRGEEARVWLKEEDKLIIEIDENIARSDLCPKDVKAFFERNSYKDKELFHKVALTLEFNVKENQPKTILELAEKFVYKKYMELMDEKPSLLYQEDAIDLLVKAGISYEEAECARRAFGTKNRLEINFYHNVFEQTARKKGYSVNKANAIFSEVERKINFTVCRAAYVAMAQYLYMDTYFKKREMCRYVCKKIND